MFNAYEFGRIYGTDESKQHKAYREKTLPNIYIEDTPQFLRGYFETHGNLHYGEKKSSYKVTFFAESREFLADVAFYLRCPELSVGCIKRNNRKEFQLQICGAKRVVNTLNYMYENSTDKNRDTERYSHYLDCIERARHHRTGNNSQVESVSSSDC